MTPVPPATLPAVTLVAAIGVFLLLTAIGASDRLTWILVGVTLAAGAMFTLADWRANRKP